MKREHWKLILIFAIVALLATLAALLFPGPPSGSPPASMPLPNPNGYDTFLKAASQLSGDTENALTLDPARLPALVDANSNALALARTGFDQQYCVPLSISQRERMYHGTDVRKLKMLGTAFVAEGRVAESEQRLDSAARSYLDAIRLGIRTARGGVMFDALIGVVIERNGIAGLEPLILRADAGLCRQIAVAVETFDAQRTPWQETLDREREGSRLYPRDFRQRLGELLPAASRARKSVETSAQRRVIEEVTRTRRFLITIAARAYEVEKGHRAAALADLVPDYLKAIPRDPVGGTNMTYTP
jgi:hypothetical protein